MKFSSSYYPYEKTGAFNAWVTDFLNDDHALSSFYEHSPDINGIKSAIKARNSIKTERELLVEKFTKQYQEIADKGLVEKNIALLKNENCFTVCTAHQPHLFTGPLYFVYKILHAIRLAEDL